MAAKIYRINYKSDFVLRLQCDAGWGVPFCIKFWTKGNAQQAFYAGYDGETYTNCYMGDTPDVLVVTFDDHQMGVGELFLQVGYHLTAADFPTGVEDEVLNQQQVKVLDPDTGEECVVLLDFQGDTAPDIQYSLPAYANEAQRIANEEQRIANEEQRISNEQQRIRNEEGRISAEETRQSHELQRIRNEETRIEEFAQLKSAAIAATDAATDAASLANEKAQLAADKAALAQSAATLANEKAQLADDKAALANEKAQLANDKAALAQQKADYAQEKGDYAKEQGDYAKEQGDYAKEQAEAASELQQKLEAGEVVPALAGNLQSWAERGTLPTEDEWEGVVRTSGGDLSIVSNQGAELISIKAGAGQFKATALQATGFNLLHNAVAVGSGYYFLVPKMTFGTFGTAEEPNGILFTDNNHNNLKPTVYFKPLSGGMPTSITDGSACTYTDSNGYRFYTTPQAGYLIVSGITFANTCAHIAWSMRYDEFISPTDAADAGSSVALTSVIAAIHNYGYMIGVVSAGVLVSDTIERTSATAVKWTRNCDRVVPTWTNTDNGDGTYTHTATITAMKANGGAALDGKVLTVTGQSVSYADDTATGSTDYVRYELATPATGTASLATHLSIEDFGLEEFTGAEGSAVVKMQYYANYADILALIAQLKMAVAVKDIASNKARVEHAELEIAASQEYDLPGLPTMQGQPIKLFGAGTPQEAIVPDNWIQFADGGFDWNGLPSTLGQEYINTSVNSAGHYTAVRDGNNLKWVNS